MNYYYCLSRVDFPDFPHVEDAISVNFRSLSNPCRLWPDRSASLDCSFRCALSWLYTQGEARSAS